MLSIGLRAIRWRIAPLVHAPPLVAATTRLMATRPKRKPMMAPQPKQEAVGARTGEDASMLQLASLRLICDQGKVLGVMPPQQARDEAAARGLLLLEVQARAEPPIWRLVATLPSRAEPIDEAAPSRSGPGSQGRGSAGKQTTMRPVNKEARVKEMRLVDKSADHDVETKMNFARGQLEKGRIVQVHMDMDMDLNMDMDMHMHMHRHTWTWTWTWTWTQHGHSMDTARTRHARGMRHSHRMHVHVHVPGVHHGHRPDGAGHDHLARGNDHGAPRRGCGRPCLRHCRAGRQTAAGQRHRRTGRLASLRNLYAAGL